MVTEHSVEETHEEGGEVLGPVLEQDPVGCLSLHSILNRGLLEYKITYSETLLVRPPHEEGGEILGPVLEEDPVGHLSLYNILSGELLI